MTYYYDKKKVLSLENTSNFLEKAREKRLQAKQLLTEGVDPGAHKKAAKAAQRSEVNDTFQTIAIEWYETRTTDFTEKHRGTVMYRMEKYIFPFIGGEHIARMEAPDILAVIEALEHKGQNETARHILQMSTRCTAMR